MLSIGYMAGHFEAVRQSVIARGGSELETLWAPFLGSKLPLIISIEDPLFAEIRSNPGVYFRDRSMNEWSDVVVSPALNSLTSSLKQPEVRPSRYYTAFGEAEASFLLGGLRRNHERALSVVRTSQISWQQLADNNVVFVGVQNLFFNQLRNLPISPQLVPELNGVRVRNPPRDSRVSMPTSTLLLPVNRGLFTRSSHTYPVRTARMISKVSPAIVPRAILGLFRTSQIPNLRDCWKRR